MERLVRLFEEFGQSPWLDNLKRGYITSGQLATLRDCGIRGLTSNPTIFQKAIADSTDYDDQYRRLNRITLAGDVPVSVRGERSRSVAGDASDYSVIDEP